MLLKKYFVKKKHFFCKLVLYVRSLNSKKRSNFELLYIVGHVL